MARHHDGSYVNINAPLSFIIYSKFSKNWHPRWKSSVPASRVVGAGRGCLLAYTYSDLNIFFRTWKCWWNRGQWGKDLGRLTVSADCSCFWRSQPQGLADLPRRSHIWSLQGQVLQRAWWFRWGCASKVGPESSWGFQFFSQHLSARPTFLANWSKVNSLSSKDTQQDSILQSRILYFGICGGK